MALLGTLAYLIVRAAQGYDLIDPFRVDQLAPRLVDERIDALPWLIAATVASLCALALWLRDRRRAESAADEVRDELGGELAQAREERQRLERARDQLREWNRQLQSRLHDLQRNGGVLGDRHDVPGLVLEMSMELTDADKGLLFSRRGDSDGLALAADVGFDGDPRESPLAKRFAEQVIKRDEIIREQLGALEHAQGGEADAEIRNLIAVPLYISDEFSGVVVCVNSRSYEQHDDEVLIALGDHAGAVLENTHLHGELRDAYLGTVDMLADAIRAKDPHLGGHSREVSRYVHRVAERLGLDARGREQLTFASLLHDLGKIGITERILLKPGALTPEEYTIIKLHPRIGSRLVEQVNALAPLAPSILHHHERFDGTGYPSGLKGEQIPLESRVIGIVDAFSAMTSDRPYRGRMSLDAACEELERCAGSQFDPEVVRLFVEEVRADPPEEDHDDDALVEAMDDPELRSRRDEGELLVGAGPFELIDNLTLLYCHRYFHEVAASEAERATVQGDGFGVIMVELTEIGRLNRVSGYAAGDAAIQAVAHEVQAAAVRAGGTAARYSGRQLALLIPGANQASTEACADELERSLQNGPAVRTAASSWAPGDDGDAVIDRARSGFAAAF